MADLVKKCYPDGICPDCADPIPDEAVEGDECVNCGHIFGVDEWDDLYDIDDLYDTDDIFFEEEW